MDISDLVEWGLRTIGLLLAFVLLTASLFLLPDDQQKAQSKLENWWQRMRDEVQQQAIGFMLTFIRETARSADRGFNWLFGDLFSARFFVVSGLLSCASFLFGMWFFGDYGWAVPSGILIFAVGTVWLALIGKQISDDLDKSSERYLLKDDDDTLRRLDVLSDIQKSSVSGGGYHDTGRHKPWWQDAAETLNKDAPVYIPAVVFGSSGTLVFNEALDKGIDGWVFGSAILVSFVCDALAIGFTMYAIERIIEARNGVIASFWLLLDAGAAAAMVAVPWILFTGLGRGSDPFQVFLLFVAAANLSTALPAIAYVLIAATLLLHRLLWTILLRPFYVFFVNSRVLHNRKLQASSGLALLAISWPGLGEKVTPWVKQLIVVLG